MRTLRILFAKELNAVLTSPIGYTVAAVFLLVLGYTFSLTLFATKVANLQYIFHQMYVLSILLVPVLTMRSFAEERRSETLELLLTAPVREVSIVLAKYAATLTLVLGMQRYTRDGTSIGCGFTSLAQCQESASGLAAQCYANPYYAHATRKASRRASQRPKS